MQFIKSATSHLVVVGKEVLWSGKSGKGIIKLRGARRGVWGFEEVSLVIVDGLVAEFVKEARHPILRLWERKFWWLVLGERGKGSLLEW